MKPKKNKKLFLSKETVSNLNNPQMRSLKGGVTETEPETCPVECRTEASCVTCQTCLVTCESCATCNTCTCQSCVGICPPETNLCTD